MSRRILCVFFILVFLIHPDVQSQKSQTILGVQVKPIFPVSFLGTGIKSDLKSNIRFDTELASGLSGGLLIRHGFTDLLALEAGLAYVKRKYNISVNDSGMARGSSDFSIIGYEIPLTVMVNIQLGEYIYMNAALGSSLDFYASSVRSQRDLIEQVSIRNHVFQPAVLANLGWEWRTDQSGTIYLGASYHRPFAFIYTSKVKYAFNGNETYSYTNILGNYLTLDVRYYFPADGKRKSRNELIDP